MAFKRYSDVPELADKNYKMKYSEPCVKLKDGLEVLYEGSGISPKEHPFNKRISMNRTCRNCGETHLEVIYVRWVVHMMSGDTYWDLEFHCKTCGKYSQYSYAGND